LSQASHLIAVLKGALRERQQTYAALAEGIGVSESSVKRLFSKKRLSLERLEQICGYLGLEIVDLLEMARSSEPRMTQLTQEQEQALVGDQRLLLVGLLVLSQWSAAEIVKAYRLTEAEVVKALTTLDKLGIIDLLPGNRIKLRLARNFSWRKRGPLQQFFEARVQRQFFESSFHGIGELRFVVHASLSEHSNQLLQQRMRKLAEEFDALAEEDGRAANRAGHWGTTMVLAMRPWELAIFSELRRAPR